MMDIDSAVEHLADHGWSPETQAAIDVVLLALNAHEKELEFAQEYVEGVGRDVTEQRAFELFKEWTVDDMDFEKLSQIAFEAVAAFATVAAERHEANAQNAELRRTEGKG